MTWQMVLVFGLLAGTFALMVWEKLSLDILAMLALSALLAAGILRPAEAFKVFRNDAAITVACMAVVATGCLDVEEACEAVDWKIIFLIFGMLALGMALEKTRGAELVAHTLIRGLGGWGPLVVLCIVHCAFALNSPVASGRLHARPEANI